MKKFSSSLGFVEMLEWLQLSKSEMSIYRMLSETPMTIKQLIKKTRMSERMIRAHLNSLIGKRFVYREVLEDGHLKYTYHGNPSESICDMLVKKAREFRRK